MEFIVVSPSKLKIMMDFEEMHSFEIDGDDIDYDNPRVRRSFWRILDVARERCGFESSGDKILIQFYPSNDGCEIFVTKLGLISSGAERTIAKSTRVAMLSCKLSVYKFSSPSALFSAIKLIDSESCGQKPAIYFDEGGGYYVIFEERHTSGECESSPLLEYGVELPSTIAEYVREHSRRLDFDVLVGL